MPNETAPATGNVVALDFRDPGPSRRGPAGRRAGVWLETLKPLIHHPGRWAVVRSYEGEKAGTQASAAAATLRKPEANIPSGKWEFAARSGELFAKYIGPE